MSSVKSINKKFNLINERIKYGTDGGINVDSGTLFVNPSNNRVGINTLSPSTTLDISGSLKSTTITDFSNSVGNNNQVLSKVNEQNMWSYPQLSFQGNDMFSLNQIDHPIQHDKYLVHACLEGPEAGVYYRGEGKITNGESVEITLPEYTKNFYNFTVQITPINSRNVYGVSRVIDGKFKVLGDNGDFFWLAHGARKEIQVEPSKSDVLVRGDGPYTYISK